MSTVEFEDTHTPHRNSNSLYTRHRVPVLVRWGFAKDTRQANLIMAIVTAVSVITTISLVFVNQSSGTKKYREDFTIDEINRMLPEMRDNLPSRIE